MLRSYPSVAELFSQAEIVGPPTNRWHPSTRNRHPILTEQGLLGPRLCVMTAPIDLGLLKSAEEAEEASCLITTVTQYSVESAAPVTVSADNRFACLARDMFNEKRSCDTRISRLDTTAELRSTEETERSSGCCVSRGTQTDDFLTIFNFWDPQLSVEGERSRKSGLSSCIVNVPRKAKDDCQVAPASEISHLSGQGYETTLWSDPQECQEYVPDLDLVARATSLSFDKGPDCDTMVSVTTVVPSNRRSKSWARRLLHRVLRLRSVQRV